MGTVEVAEASEPTSDTALDLLSVISVSLRLRLLITLFDTVAVCNLGIVPGVALEGLTG